MKEPTLPVMTDLEHASSVYDVMTILFWYLTSGQEKKNLQAYRRWLSTRQGAANLSKIVQQMLSSPNEDFQPSLYALIDLYKKEPAHQTALMVDTLFCFDNDLSERHLSRQSSQLLNAGPMNSEWCHQLTKARLYFLLRGGLQERFLAHYGLRRGGKLTMAHPGGLRSQLTHFTVLRDDELGGLSPEISAYCVNDTVREALENGPLKIAVFSFGNRPWFSLPPSEGPSELCVAYTPEQDEAIVQTYVHALKLAEQYGADLAAFPELALGAAAREKLRNRLQAMALQMRHLKLIFAGSEWVNGVNAAYILTASGKLLLSQKKREPFEVKKTHQWEALVDHENQLLFLDVAGLGRISYVICRDFLDMAERLVRADLLGSGLWIASCYTPEIKPFLAAARELAALYGAVTLVCNACSAAAQKTPLDTFPCLGCLAVPACNERKEVGCTLEPCTVRGVSCGEAACALGDCMDLYTLFYAPEEAERLKIDHIKI